MSQTANPGEIGAALLSPLLADPRLSAYYHPDTDPERFPLQIVNASATRLAAPDPATTGIAATLLDSGQTPDPRRATLILDTVTIGGDTASVSFRFPIEGVAGKATLVQSRDGAWSVSEMSLVEQ